MMDQIKVQMRIVISLIIATTSSADVQVRNLTGIEGGSITLPDSVWEKAFLLYDGKVIATVINSELDITEEFNRGRIHWNDDGRFSITGLQKNDSGIFAIDSKKGRVFFSSYKLVVYESVPDPEVSTLTVSNESCILRCSVQKGDGTTLSWYRGEELLNQSSSLFSLSVTVHKQNLNTSYRCEASNPAENKNLSVNVAKSCQQEQRTTVSLDTTNYTRDRALGIAVPIVCLLSVVLFAVIFKWRSPAKTKTAQTRESDVVYTDVVITDARNGQCKNPPSPAINGTSLTTVYANWNLIAAAD